MVNCSIIIFPLIQLGQSFECKEGQEVMEGVSFN